MIELVLNWKADTLRHNVFLELLMFFLEVQQNHSHTPTPSFKHANSSTASETTGK